MQTLQQVYVPSLVSEKRKQSIVARFMAWCTNQEENRLGWLATILAVHGCVLTPATVITVAQGSNDIALWGLAMGAMAMSLVTNLAAMPAKITIPVFFTSVVIDLAVIGISLNSIFGA